MLLGLAPMRAPRAGPQARPAERSVADAGAGVRTRPPRRLGDRVGFAWALATAAGWFTLGYVRYRRLHAGASDLGIFDQAAWLLAHGRAPFITEIGVNVFADHVSPVIVLFAPLYRIAATPVWLLAVQAVCLGLTVLPMRALARELGAPPWVASVAVAASAPLLSSAVYDVHPVVFATPAVAWALLAARRDDVRAATIATALVACCRADAVIALAGIAIVALPRVRRRLLWLVPVPLLLSVVIPHVLGTWQTFGHYYHRLGRGWGDLALHPWRLPIALVAPTSLRQLVIWLLPAGFLPLLRPRWFVAVVVAGLPLLLSSWPGIPVPWYHHAAYLVPLAVGGALAVLGRPPAWLRGRGPRSPALALGLLGIGVIIGLLLTSPLSSGAPESVRLSVALGPPRPGVAAAIAAVGPTEGVAAQNEVLGHLSRRTDAYIWPCPFSPGETGRACSHGNLLRRSNRVDVVVLVGPPPVAALRRLGFTSIDYHDGFTEARRPKSGR
ncbi:MAG: Protein of unknown function rane [Acidimicrobiales bacterium]|nr:Protein of unknown function rane [Acidimicrobiales bacterium]